jgi:hypothetical protein
MFSGFCGTYTAGSANIQSNLSGPQWQSCVVKPVTTTTQAQAPTTTSSTQHPVDISVTTTTTVAPVEEPTLCPAGFQYIASNLDGASKLWAVPNSQRTVEQCGQICATRAGCTGFEYAAEGAFLGFCATYTGGNANVRGSAQAVGWRSCMLSEENSQVTTTTSNIFLSATTTSTPLQPDHQYVPSVSPGSRST